jgi:hypothetical protein
MDPKLCDEIILAAAEELMYDAQERFDAWVATRDSAVTRAKDPAAAAAGDLGVEFFMTMAQILGNILNSFPGGVAAGLIANEISRRLHRTDPTLTGDDREAIGKIVEEHLVNAGAIKVEGSDEQPQ